MLSGAVRYGVDEGSVNDGARVSSLGSGGMQKMGVHSVKVYGGQR